MGRNHLFSRRTKELRTIVLSPIVANEKESGVSATNTESLHDEHYLRSSRVCTTSIQTEPSYNALNKNTTSSTTAKNAAVTGKVENEVQKNDDDLPTELLMQRAGCFPGVKFTTRNLLHTNTNTTITSSDNINKNEKIICDSKSAFESATIQDCRSSDPTNHDNSSNNNEVTTKTCDTSSDSEVHSNINNSCKNARKKSMDKKEEKEIASKETHIGQTDKDDVVALATAASCLPKRRKLYTTATVSDRTIQQQQQQQQQEQNEQRKKHQYKEFVCDDDDDIDDSSNIPHHIRLIDHVTIVNESTNDDYYELELTNRSSNNNIKIISTYKSSSSSSSLGIRRIDNYNELVKASNDDQEDDDHDVTDDIEEDCSIVSFVPSKNVINEFTSPHASLRCSTLTSSTQYEWFPSAICLSTLHNDRCVDNNKNPKNQNDTSNLSIVLLQSAQSKIMKYFIPVPQCIVQNSCLRHIQLYSTLVDNLSSNKIKQVKAIKANKDIKSEYYHSLLVRQQQQQAASSASARSNNKDMNSMILHDPIHARNVMMEFVQEKNYDSAIIMTKQLLYHFQGTIKRCSVSTSTMDIVVSLHGQLVILYLAVGRNGEAVRYSTEAVQKVKALQEQEQQKQYYHRSIQLVDALLRHALVLFSTNKVSQAKKALREALQTAIASNGYTDSIVSVLLCNIGVMHLECGHNVKASIRSLEESIEVQKTILKDGNEVRQNNVTVDEAMYRLATTISNLAIAYERVGEMDRSISLLEESMNLYESIELNTSVDVEMTKKQLLRITSQKEYNEKNVDDTILNSSIESETGFDFKCQLFDNEQSGVLLDNFINSSHPFDDDEESDNEANVDDSDVDGYESERSMTLFGNSDGVPSSRVHPWVWLEESDNHDFLLLGTLVPELSAEQRVCETVKIWNGRHYNDSKSKSISTSSSSSKDLGANATNISPISLENLKYKLNFNGETVLDADLHLNEIHKQAMIFIDENNIDAAISILYGALQSHRAKYGEKHHLVGSALHNIGMVLFFAQRYSDALIVFENAVLVRVEALSSHHPDVQCSMLKIALLHIAMGNTHDAYDMLMDIRDTLLLVQRKQPQNVSKMVFGTLLLAKVNNNIGVIAYEFGDYNNALESFKSAYDSQRQIYKRYKMDEQHQNSLDHHNNNSGSWKVLKLARLNTLCNMAFIYSKMGDKERGLELYDKAYSILSGLVPMYHPSIVSTLTNIDILVEAIYHNTTP